MLTFPYTYKLFHPVNNPDEMSHWQKIIHILRKKYHLFEKLSYQIPLVAILLTDIKPNQYESI